MVFDHEVRQYVKDTYGDCSPESFEKLAEDLADKVHIFDCIIPVRDANNCYVNVHDAEKGSSVRAYRREIVTVLVPKGDDPRSYLPKPIDFNSVIIFDGNGNVLKNNYN